ncbi:MAG: OmpA family protein [Ottowia sp.]|nr:OmpA family protein [Ottowia sp.]
MALEEAPCIVVWVVVPFPLHTERIAAEGFGGRQASREGICPTGNAAANAELSKKRAENVRDALVGMGIDAERMTLEKPAEATDEDVSLAEARRVEVRVSE